MIKVGILGAETMTAGELIRILINHPDVTIKTIASETEAGRDVTSLHKGLTGDIDMKTSGSLPAEGHDVVFLCGEPWEATEWLERNSAAVDDTDLRIIDLTGACRRGEHGMVYGFPEFSRKALVRGALRASVPSAAAIAIELALFPLAKNGVLTDDINASVSMAATEMHHDSVMRQQRAGTTQDPTNVAISTRLDPIAPQEHRTDGEAAASEAAMAMHMMQPSFRAGINVRIARIGTLSRGLTATVDVPCGVNVAEVQRMYDDAYSDHGFTFPVHEQPSVEDVANTNKCLLSISYPQGGTGSPDFIGDVGMRRSGLPVLRITVAIDNLLKGAAGTAVHCMNLLFGLSERTGLSLKASAV